jgi:hypothetical protein
MRFVLAAVLALATTACLRSTPSPDLDASSNGNNNGGSNNNNNGGPDAGTTNHPDAGTTNHPDSGTMMVDAAPMGPPCKNQQSPPGSGHHNAGQNCMSSCHFHGFTLAGTLYTSPTGSTPISGGVITVKDAAGQTFDIVSQTNGNFYTSNSVQFPVTVYASDCQVSQTSQVMTASISSSQGGCNMSGCHTTSAQGHIHLP